MANIREIENRLLSEINQKDNNAETTAKKDVFDRTNLEFGIGDLVKVNIKIVEGKRERIQSFEGYVIAFKGSGITRTFKVRKISYGVGVEKTFPIYSPSLDGVILVRKGRIRRAKLYYMRDRAGKKSNIKEKINFKKIAG